jgi:hypothetical protein
VKENLVNIFISPYFLALPITLVIILFLPPIEKYKIDFIKKAVTDKPDCAETFIDVNEDGYSEKIILFNNQRGDAAIKIVDQSNILLEWHDFKGSMYHDTPKPGDYNHDGKPELYFISNKQDSVFLNILYPITSQSHNAKQKFITKTNLNDRISDYTTGDWHLCDLQVDGFDEVLFTVFAGYSLQPRRLFAYDQKNDSILSSPVMGSKTGFIPVQLNEDAYPEFISQSSSSGNISSDMNIPYRDSSSWLMALDHKLNFIFKPIEFKGHKSSLQCQSILTGGNYRILALFEFSSAQPWIPVLMLYDNQGNLIKKKNLLKPTGQAYFSLIDDQFPEQNSILIKDAYGSISRVDENWHLKKIAQIPENCPSNYESFDLDNDGTFERVFLSNDFEMIYITRNNFSNLTFHQISFERERSFLSLQENGMYPPFLFVQRGDREIYYQYGFNTLWYAKFPIWLGIYFFVLGFIHIVRKFQIIQQRKSKEREDRLAELQLGAVSTYLDPHFTFNTLNTITSLIYKEEKVKAHEIITRFTSLIRSTLMQSGQAGRKLSEELEFVKDYLDIQKFRFGNSFTWEIRYDETVDLLQTVPKMLVQQYAENAIKHGLKNKGAGGRLDIIIENKGKETKITIRDNGVGRFQAQINNEPGTGKGLVTMQQIFDLFEKTNKIKISQTINDLRDDVGNPSGTEIILEIK